MKPLLRTFLCLALAVVAARAETLTVSAAASLKDVFTEIKTLYANERGDVTLLFNFAGSGTLQQQIEAGAPVDVFASAAPKQIDAAEKKGLLLAGSRRDLLTNTLVLIAPKDDASLKAWTDLTAASVKRIAIGEPKSVPAGAYAIEVLAKLDLRTALEPKLVQLLDVRQVLTTVATRNADAGVVYATDARVSGSVRVVAAAPPGSHERIVYPIAVIAASKQTSAAQEFVRYLGGERARATFERFGFGVAK